MKMMKTALLATAAIAAVTTGARADELSDLKAQIEALNARMSQYEAAPAVPAGFQLVSISKGKALKFGLDSDVDAPATLISVLPAADAPAGTTLSINGNVKAGIKWDNEARDGDNDLDVLAGGGFTIAGVTDTAVGEIGAKLGVSYSYDSETGGRDIGNDGFWGYWAFADGMKLGGGSDGSLAGLGHGIEAKTSRHLVGTVAGVAQGGNGDPAQLRLSYSSGPLGFAVAIEDASRNAFYAGAAAIPATDLNGDGDTLDPGEAAVPAVAADPNQSDDDALGFAGEVTYAGDMFSVELAAGMWGDDDMDSATNSNKKYQVGAGLGFNIADGVSMSLGGTSGKRHNNGKFWNVGASTRLSVADGISFELGAGMGKDSGVKSSDVLGGIYYSPVSQLILGLEGGFGKVGGVSSSAVALVTKYSF